jgi:hypothetical protein
LPRDLKKQIAQAKDRYERHNESGSKRLKLEVRRIGRTSQPFEHISTDIDFSSERIDELITQGEGAATEFLESVAAGAGDF